MGSKPGEREQQTPGGPGTRPCLPEIGHFTSFPHFMPQIPLCHRLHQGNLEHLHIVSDLVEAAILCP